MEKQCWSYFISEVFSVIFGSDLRVQFCLREREGSIEAFLLSMFSPFVYAASLLPNARKLLCLSCSAEQSMGAGGGFHFDLCVIYWSLN